MAASIPTERDIINGLRENTSQRHLYEDFLYRQFSYFIAEGQRKYSLSYEDSFSAYSDSVINVIHNIGNGSFEGRSSLKSYIFSIFHHKCVDLLRKNTTNKSQVNHTVPLTEMMNALSDTARSVVQQMIARADIGQLRERLREIGEKCRQMLLLHAEGFSDKEIALELEYQSPEVVKVSRARCLGKLRDLYQSKRS